MLSSTISHLVKGVDEEIRYFRNRKLSAAYPYVIVDARYEKVRVNRRVISSGVFIAIGINQDGFREVLSFELARSETEDCWRILFQGLLQRGLMGVQLVVSDDHLGLKKAIDRCFTGASWQR